MKSDNKMKTYVPTNEGDPHSFAGYYAIDDNTTHSLLAKYLVDSTEGVVYCKPADKIARAIKIMYSALVDLDGWRVEYVAAHMPEVFKLAQLYSDVYGSPNVSLFDYIMTEHMGPNYLEKLKSYRANPPGIFKKEEV